MARIAVRVTPRASRDTVARASDGALAVRVTAAPTDGQANEAVTRLLAKALGLPPRDVVLVSGATARQKTFDIPLTAEEIASRLAMAT
jgi:uncharacterized protein (TIGR00251 family)